MRFTKRDAERVGEVLKVKPKSQKNSFLFNVGKTSLEIFPKIKIGKKSGTLVSVYTPYSHLQLHFCTGYVASDLLSEVTFISEHDGMVSGLIIEANGACSFYANLDKEILSGDFTKLEPQVMIPGIALSLGELLIEKKTKK